MANDVGTGDDGRARSDAIRRYPPVLFLALAVLVALAILPSALTLPQSNPSETVEIAPVPPDEEAPPVQGNVSDFTLGEGSSQLGEGALGGDQTFEPLPPPPPEGEGGGKTSRDKDCRNSPLGPRQTADIISPPCAAFFEGDNGGATYQGVTAEEVRILVYDEGGIVSTPTPRGNDASPTNQLINLDGPAQPNEHGAVATLRVWFKYFNDRYQLYGRKAHGYLYWSGADGSQQKRQADAAAAYSRVKPFAVVSVAAYFGSPDAFLIYMAQQGVLNFGSIQGRPQEFFGRFPKLIWGFPPSLEQQAKVFNDYICTKVATSQVSVGPMRGQARKYGLIYTSDPNFPNLPALKDSVKAGAEACGVTFLDESTFPNNGFAVDPITQDGYAVQGMGRFKDKGINTIIWAGGTEVNYTRVAQTNQYFPEWFVVGDKQNDAQSYATRVGGTQAWQFAWNITPTVRIDSDETRVCYQEYRSQDPNVTPDADIVANSCPIYDDLRQLFSGLQVAGPRLGPFSVDKGYHAIPAIPSADPRTPACFYDPGDYTCVKDAEVMYFDATAQTPDTGAEGQPPGCWRMTYGGQRFLAGKFPRGAPAEDKNKTPGGDPCNQYSANYNLNNDPGNRS